MKRITKKILSALCALAVGAVNGFFGGGGGMIAVPLLSKGLKLSTRTSHATAIAVILPISIAGGITYAAGGYFTLIPTLTSALGCVAGGALGALLLKKLPAKVTAIIFAVIMIAVGVKLTFF